MKTTRLVMVGHPRDCGNREPHAPHVVEPYDTVRNGECDFFCHGQAGPGVTIERTYYEAGNSDHPARAKYTVTTAETAAPPASLLPALRADWRQCDSPDQVDAVTEMVACQIAMTGRAGKRAATPEERAWADEVDSARREHDAKEGTP